MPFLTATRPRHYKPTSHISHNNKIKHKTPVKKKAPVKKKISKKKKVKKHIPKLIVAFRRKMVVTAFVQHHSNGRRRHIGNGKYATKGSVAVCYRQIPKGSKMFIQKYGWGRAVSTGGAMRKDRIDICLPTLKAARKWGRRTVWVTVYKLKK